MFLTCTANVHIIVCSLYNVPVDWLIVFAQLKATRLRNSQVVKRRKPTNKKGRERGRGRGA